MSVFVGDVLSEIKCSSVSEDAREGLDFVELVFFVACLVGTCACARTARSARIVFVPPTKLYYLGVKCIG